MVRRCQAIEHRHGGATRELVEVVDPFGANGDPVDIPAEDGRRVLDRFAPLQLEIVNAQEDRLPAKLLHSCLERGAGAGAGMLEDQAQGFAGQPGVRDVLGPQALEHLGRLQDRRDLVGEDRCRQSGSCHEGADKRSRPPRVSRLCVVGPQLNHGSGFHAILARLAKRMQQERLVHVQPVLGLVENDRLRSIRHLGRHFLVPVHRQAVHEDRLRVGFGHQTGVTLYGASATARAAPSSWPMTDVDIGVDGVGTLDRRSGVVGDVDRGAVGWRSHRAWFTISRRSGESGPRR